MRRWLREVVRSAKNLAGESPPPDSNPLNDVSLEKSRRLVKPIRRNRKPLIPVREKRLAFHPHAQRNAFCRYDARQQRRLLVPESQRNSSRSSLLPRCGRENVTGAQVSN